MVTTHPTIRRRHTDPGEAILVAPHPRTGAWGEWRMPLQLEDGHGAYYPTGVTVDNAGAFPPKQVIGDYREGDHEALSFLTQNTWHGAGHARGGAADRRGEDRPLPAVGQGAGQAVDSECPHPARRRARQRGRQRRADELVKSAGAADKLELLL